MSKYHTPKDYLDAAKSTNTSPPELRGLAKSSWDFVRTAIASNPNSDSEVLNSLTPERIETWNEQELALVLVQNPNTPEQALERLATCLLPVLDNGREHQLGFKAGVLLCNHPLMHLESIRWMLYAEHVAKQFRKVVARETQRRDVLEVLLTDRSEIVRRQAEKSIQAIDAIKPY